MAIVIPSKHIYEKDNDKVRDNKVDKVEVKGIRPYISAYEKSEVYSESSEISVDEYITKNKTNVTYGLLENVPSGITTVKFTIACVQLVYTKYVKTYKIRIPKNIKNKVINTIYMGKDENEQPNISCKVTCTKYKETDVRGHQTFLIDPKITNTTVKLSGDINYPNFVDRERIGTITMSVPQGNMEYKNTFSSNYSTPEFTKDYTVKVDFTDDSTNLVTAEMQYDEKTSEYTCNLTVLVGYEIQKLFGTITDVESAQTDEYSDSMNLKGEGELYEPNSIKLSFKGDYITIDLVNKTVTINGDGTHPISFDGNELIQTTNYVMDNGKRNDYITTAFGNTMKLYENGKETATILCDIYNYVDAVKFKVLEYELLEDGSVYCRLKTDNINDIYDLSNMGYIYVNGIEGFVQDIDEEEFVLIVYFNNSSVIDYLKKNEITINHNANFYFNIGDVVIPMVYGANGVDKPMSKYKDGTPKKFKVLGTRIFYDGAVWQELTLQETLE